MMEWLDHLAVPGTLKSLLQHHGSILRCSAFFIVQLSNPYMTTGKIIALTKWTFVGKIMSLFFNIDPVEHNKEKKQKLLANDMIYFEIYNAFSSGYGFITW